MDNRLTIKERQLAASLLGGSVIVSENGTVMDCDSHPLGVCKKPTKLELDDCVVWDIDYKAFGDLKLVKEK
jgi:hypothetical protein